MPTHPLSDPVVAVFVVIPVSLVLLLLCAAAVAYPERRAVVVGTVGVIAATWMAGTWVVAAGGSFREWGATPPPFAFLVLGVVGLSALLAWSPFGGRLATRIPVWILVLVQAFRFPLELAMHAMYERGVMPVQMSYSGLNFDIATGITAVLVAWMVRAGRGRVVAGAWNVIGLLLVVNVAAIGIVSTPRFGYFGIERLNVWITYPPFVWLPAVMVLAALAGHLLIFRALRAASAADRTRVQP